MDIDNHYEDLLRTEERTRQEREAYADQIAREVEKKLVGLMYYELTEDRRIVEHTVKKAEVIGEHYDSLEVVLDERAKCVVRPPTAEIEEFTDEEFFVSRREAEEMRDEYV